MPTGTLAERIAQVLREPDGTFGVPGVTAELKDSDRWVDHRRVMREGGGSEFSKGLVADLAGGESGTRSATRTTPRSRGGSASFNAERCPCPWSGVPR